MADLLVTATAGLRTFQQALNVTGHNIANVNTEGYSRQRVEIGAGVPHLTAGGFVGSGSRAESINRVYQDYLSNQLNSSYTYQSKYNQIDVYSTQLNGTLGNPEVGISAGMQSLFSAWHNIANDPTSPYSTQHLLDTQSMLSMQVESYHSMRSDLHDQVNGHIQAATTQVNQLMNELVTLNEALGSLNMRSELPANDLLDKRDMLVKELNQYIDTKVFQNKDGTIDVYSADGKVPLITDNRAMPIYVRENPMEKYDLDNGAPVKNPKLELWINAPGTGNPWVISDHIKGGELGGALAFRNDQLQRAEDELGLSVAGMALAANAQHRQGYDVAGIRGDNIFSLNGKPSQLMEEASAYNTSTNTGNGSISLTGTPSQEFAYKVTYNGTDYDITDAYSNRAVATVGSLPHTIDGVDLDITGTPNKGDSFMLFTTTDFYAQSEQTAFADTRNKGTLGNNDITINLNKLGLSNNPTGAKGIANDMSNPADFEQLQSQLAQLQPRSYSLSFDGQFYTVSDARTGQVIPYQQSVDDATNAPGITTLRFEGLQIDIDQTTNKMKAGDQFELRFLNDAVNAFNTELKDTNKVAYRGGDLTATPVGSQPLASGNNVNAANLASLQDKKILSNGQNTFTSAFAQMVGNVGTYHKTNQISMDTQNAVYNQLNQVRDSVSGVSLDEEAANMLRFQQAYQAAAQIMQASQRMFDTLISVM